MSELLQSGHHPDADQLNAFVEHALPAHAHQETLAHLATCPDCRAVVALALPFVEEARPAAETVRPPKSFRWPIFWPAAGAAALAALLLVTFHIRNASVRPVVATNPDLAANHAPTPPALIKPQPVAPALQQSPAAPLRSKPPASAPPPALTTPSAPQGLVGGVFQGRSVMPAPAAAPAPQSATQIATQSTGSVAGAAGMASGSGEGVAPNSYLAGMQTLPLNGRMVGPASAAPFDANGQALSASAPSLLVLNSPLQSAQPVGAILARLPLPSGLPALSIASSERRNQTIAVDIHGALFFSDDRGSHWKPVPLPWRGRALKAELAGTPPAYALPSRSRAFAAPKQKVESPPAADSAGGPIAIPAMVAQGEVSGIVTDTTGAVIPGATVIVSASPTQLAHAVRTDASGRYVVDGLPQGTYAIEAEAPGFNARQVAGVTVEPGRPGLANLSLAIGAASQSVMVSAAAAETAPAMKLDEGDAVKPAAPLALPVFEITTDAGEHWVSADGRNWRPK